MSIPALYRSLYGFALQWLADECDTRVTNLVWLMVGIFQSRSVQMNRLVRKLPIQAKKLSLVTRMGRFLSNEAVRVREWYAPSARAILTNAGRGGRIRLILDATKVSSGHRLLMVSVAYQRRSVPLAWTWVRTSRGHSSTAKQVKLLAYVQSLCPSGVQVALVGDCEFDHPLLIENISHWGWDYALRQAGRYLVWPHGCPTWQRIDSLALLPGESRWLGHILLTTASPFPTHLVLHWQVGQQAPWYLATNLLGPQAAIHLYSRRLWIEEMFGDMKKHGFDLESSHLHHFLRLSRLTLVVCLLYLWLLALGEHVLQHGLSAQIDRTDRRDLSIFRLGWDFLEDCLRLAQPIPSIPFLNFCSVSGR